MRRLSPRKKAKYEKCQKEGCDKPARPEHKYCSRDCAPLGHINDSKEDNARYGFCYDPESSNSSR